MSSVRTKACWHCCSDGNKSQFGLMQQGLQPIAKPPVMCENSVSIGNSWLISALICHLMCKPEDNGSQKSLDGEFGSAYCPWDSHTVFRQLHCVSNISFICCASHAGGRPNSSCSITAHQSFPSAPCHVQPQPPHHSVSPPHHHLQPSRHHLQPSHHHLYPPHHHL